MPGIVIRELGIVYWPIPKNACTAIKTKIAQIQNLAFHPKGWPHTAPFEWTADTVPGLKNIVLVRNPIERFISLWINKIMPGHPIGGDDYVNGLDMSVFRNFPRIRSDMPFLRFARECFKIPFHQADPHWARQTDQFPSGTKIYRMEEETWLLKCLFPRMNVNPSIDLPEFHSRDFLSRAVNFYRQDLIQLNYNYSIPMT